MNPQLKIIAQQTVDQTQVATHISGFTNQLYVNVVNHVLTQVQPHINPELCEQIRHQLLWS